MKMVSPVGTAVYPHLNTPDTKYVDDGEFKTQLSVPEEEASKFISSLEEAYNSSYSKECTEQKKPKLKKADMPWVEEYDEDGNSTGNILFKFKMKAKTKTGIELRPLIVDSDRKGCDSAIGSGSKLKVAFEARSWVVPALGVGMTLRLRGVQILDLVEWSGGASAQSLGFGVEEGFVAPEKVEEQTAPADSDDDSDF